MVTMSFTHDVNDIIIGAEITSIEFDNSGRHIQEIHVRTPQGEYLKIIGSAYKTLIVL
jgi:hypothetical protein